MLRLLFSAAASGGVGCCRCCFGHCHCLFSSIQYSCSHCGAKPFIGRVCTLACAHPTICVCVSVCIGVWCCDVHNEMCENPPPKQNVFLVNFVRLLPAPFPFSLAALLLWYGVCGVLCCCCCRTATKPYRSPFVGLCVAPCGHCIFLDSHLSSVCPCYSIVNVVRARTSNSVPL